MKPTLHANGRVKKLQARWANEAAALEMDQCHHGSWDVVQDGNRSDIGVDDVAWTAKLDTLHSNSDDRRIEMRCRVDDRRLFLNTEHTYW